MLCLLVQVLPFSVFGAAAQEPVTKNGAIYDEVTTVTGNSGSISGDKITANGAKYDIVFYDDIAGSLVFNKQSSCIEIIIAEHVDVVVTWNCGSKYASCTLKGMGVYELPQLRQDNGKTQNFAAIWIQAVDASDAMELPDFIEASIAMMYRNAPESKIAEIRELWREQINLKVTEIVATRGAVRSLSLSSEPIYMDTFIRKEEFGGGTVTGPESVVGTSDLRFARFYTPSLDQGVGVAGTLSGDGHGSTYITARLGLTGAGKTGNYAIVWGSNTGEDWSWVPIGYAQVSSTATKYLYVGTTGARYYQYVSVTANTVMNDETLQLCVYNDIEVDCISMGA